MEQMVALLLLAYAIGLWSGETLCSTLFPEGTRKHKLCSTTQQTVEKVTIPVQPRMMAGHHFSPRMCARSLNALFGGSMKGRSWLLKNTLVLA
jgi:hypothetical protein